MIADYYMYSNEKIHSHQQITCEEKNEINSTHTIQNTP